MPRVSLVVILLFAARAMSAGAERFTLAVDPSVTCPARPELDRAFGDLQAQGHGTGRSIHVEPGSGALRIELRSPEGEQLAVRELKLGESPCAELARTIALLAATWSETFPWTSIAPPYPEPESAPPVVLAATPDAGALPSEAPPVHEAPPLQRVPVVASPPAASPPPPEHAGFAPGPLLVRLSGLVALDVPTSDTGGGGQLAVELGLSCHFSVGLSAALLTNLLETDLVAGGSLFLHRQRYTLFASLGSALRRDEWLSAEVGLQEQHFIASTSYPNGLSGKGLDAPAVAVHVLYSRLLWGPLFGFAQGGADIVLASPQFYLVVDPGGTKQTLYTVSPLSLDLQLGLGLRFL